MHRGYLHTSFGAGGFAASSPLTWHAVLRFTRAGRDHVEDLGGPLVGGAVGFLGDTAGHRWPRRAGNGLSFVGLIPFGLDHSGVLALERWRNTEEQMVKSEEEGTASHR